MLCTQFAGRNHLFLRKIKFFHLFPSLTEKKKEKRKESAKIIQINWLTSFMTIFFGFLFNFFTLMLTHALHEIRPRLNKRNNYIPVDQDVVWF